MGDTNLILNKNIMKARHDFTTDKEWLDYLQTYFAAMAMQGIICNMNNEVVRQAIVEACKKGSYTVEGYVASMAVEQADALITELNK